MALHSSSHRIYAAAGKSRARLLRRLLARDQSDRENTSWSYLQLRDAERARFASACYALRPKLPLSDRELYAISIIMHHAEEYRTAGRAAELLWRRRSTPENAWLVAIIADRDWIYRSGGQQLYGTQFWKNSDGCIVIRSSAPSSIARRPDILKGLAKTSSSLP